MDDNNKRKSFLTIHHFRDTFEILGQNETRTIYPPTLFCFKSSLFNPWCQICHSIKLRDCQIVHIHSCWMQKSGLRVIQSQPKSYFHGQICSKSARHGKSCQFLQDRACIPDPHLISGFLINHRCPRLLLYCPLIISVYLGDVVHYELRSNSFASPRLPRYDHALVLAV